jgi:hypothetical protein
MGPLLAVVVLGAAAVGLAGPAIWHFGNEAWDKISGGPDQPSITHEPQTESGSLAVTTTVTVEAPPNP